MVGSLAHVIVGMGVQGEVGDGAKCKAQRATHNSQSATRYSQLPTCKTKRANRMSAVGWGEVSDGAKRNAQRDTRT